MAKTYQKIGNTLKESDNVVVEKDYKLKELRNWKRDINRQIDELQIIKAYIQSLIDKCTELSIQEEN